MEYFCTKCNCTYIDNPCPAHWKSLGNCMISNIFGMRRNKADHEHRKFPCLLENKITKDVAIWHSPTEYTYIVVNDEPRYFDGKPKKPPVIGELITCLNNQPNKGLNWTEVDPNEQFVLGRIK